MTENMFKYNDFGIDEETLKPIRHALYHSDGLGYVVMSDFVSEQFVAHYQAVWTEVEPYYLHSQFQGWNKLQVGSPNLERDVPGVSRMFVNFFWNPPLDDVAHAVSLYIAVLKNRIEAKPAVAGIFPHPTSKKPQRTTSFRVVRTLNQAVSAPPHRDWVEPDSYDLARLQATLFLSTPGVDYSGDGFILVTNGGERKVFGKDVKVKAGDLVLWRYNNQHAVMNVSSTEGQLGFLRVLHPPELLGDPEQVLTNRGQIRGGAPNLQPKRSIWNKPAGSEPKQTVDVATHVPKGSPKPESGPAQTFRQYLKHTAFGRRVLLPVYRRVRSLR